MFLFCLFFPIQAMEKAYATSFLLFTLDTQALSSALLSPWWRTRCCSWRKSSDSSERLLLDSPWAHMDPACGVSGCFPLQLGVQQAVRVPAAEHVFLRELTQPVSAVSDPWICHVGEPEAEAAKDGCWWAVSEGTYFWIHRPFVQTKVMGELFEAVRVMSKFGRASFGSEEWHLNQG